MSSPTHLGLAALVILGGCSTMLPQLNPPTGSSSGAGSSSTASSTSGGATSSSVQTSPSAGSSSTSSSIGSSAASTSSGSTGGASSCAPADPAFFGTWDTGFAQLTLQAADAGLTGSYRDWGYTIQDPQFAGTIAGTVCGDTLTGTIQSNADSIPATLSLTLADGGLSGTFIYQGGLPDPLCGVPSDAGLSLLPGCGWSDVFDVYIPGTQDQYYQLVITQTGDEVTGQVLSLAGQPIEPVYGLVSDYRLNGEYFAQINGRISFVMGRDGSQFTGNEVFGDGLVPFCGSRAGAIPILNCLGGGGGYDGTWFTNLGTLTLSQALVYPPAPPIYASPTVTGTWFFWGSDVEYPVAGTVADGLSWIDGSALGGAVGLRHAAGDTVGVTLTGFTAAGGLWCGVDYNGAAPSGADPFGTLFTGCGLSDSWSLWQGQGAPAVETLTQTRGQVVSTPGALVAVTGTLSPNPDGGSAEPLVLAGSWVGQSDTGTFAWYPDAYDQAFTGDSATSSAVSAWCGSVSGMQPNPCLQ